MAAGAMPGWFRIALPAAPIGQLAVLRLDGELYESTMDALNALYHKVVPGRFIIADDYGDFPPAARRSTSSANATTSMGLTMWWTGQGYVGARCQAHYRMKNCAL
jgi:hypothetical protein